MPGPLTPRHKGTVYGDLIYDLAFSPAFIMCVGMCIWRAALLAHAAELPRSGARVRSAPRVARPLARAAEFFSGYSGPGVVF